MNRPELEARFEAHRSRIVHEVRQEEHWDSQRRFWRTITTVAISAQAITLLIYVLDLVFSR